MTAVKHDLPARLEAWAPLVAMQKADGKPARLDLGNVELLKGLAWCCGAMAAAGEQDARVAAALQELAIGSYIKVPGQGRRCPRAGDAAVWALSQFPVDIACTRLSATARHSRNPMVDETIHVALDGLSQRTGIPRAQMEELSIPTFGIAADGTRTQKIGPCTAVLDINSGKPLLRWMKGDKPCRTPPAAVAKEHVEDIKRLKQEVKDLGRLLTSQRDRLDQLMAEPRTWTFEYWRRYHLDHPLVGVFARRLIWMIGGVEVLFQDGKPMDVQGDDRTFDCRSEVKLWHPMDATPKQLAAWQQWIMDMEIQQPFKQAFREIYHLTDTEKKSTASDRFRGKVVRQAQLRSLAQQRGWKVGYVGPWDNGGSEPERSLPAWGLRAHCSIEIPEQPKTSLPAGGAMLLAIGHVSFYPLAQENPPQPAAADVNKAVVLDQVPPRVICEVFRDIDLFASTSAAVGTENP
jgi:hypothetical protein